MWNLCLFLEFGAKVESANAYRSAGLYQAAWNGYLDACRLLLYWVAKVNPLDEWKGSVLLCDTGNACTNVAVLCCVILSLPVTI